MVHMAVVIYRAGVSLAATFIGEGYCMHRFVLSLFTDLFVSVYVMEYMSVWPLRAFESQGMDL